MPVAAEGRPDGGAIEQALAETGLLPVPGRDAVGHTRRLPAHQGRADARRRPGRRGRPRRWCVRCPQVPASLPLPEALSRLRRTNSHLALVTDADGSVIGDGRAGGPGRGPRRHGARRHPPCLTSRTARLIRRRARRVRLDDPRTAHRTGRTMFVQAAPAAPQRGEAHPVWDFLFTYYSLRPRQLRRWHPGFGVVLAGGPAQRYLGRSGYTRTGAGRRRDPRVPAEPARETVRFIAGLLRATASRPARLNCFGLHEWAMVYRAPRCATRRCRCGSAPTGPTPSSSRCHCGAATSTPTGSSPNRPPARNAERLTRERQIAAEQPGCLHAAMDLLQVGLQAGSAGGVGPGGGLPGAGGRSP